MKAKDFLKKYAKDGKVSKEEIKNHFTGNLANLEKKTKAFGAKLGDKALAYIQKQLSTESPFGVETETYSPYVSAPKPPKEEMVTVNYGSGSITVPASQAGNLTVNGTNLVELASANTPEAPGSNPVVVNTPVEQTQGVDIGAIVDQVTSGSGKGNNSTPSTSETPTDYSVEDLGGEIGGVGGVKDEPPKPYVPTKEDRKRSAKYDKTQYGFNPTAYLAAYSDVSDLAKEFAGEGTSDEEKAYLGYINASRGASFSDFNQMKTKDLYQSVAQQHFGLHGFHEGRQSKEKYQAKEQEFEEGKLDDFIKGLKDAVVSSSAAGAQAGGVSGL